MKIRTVGADSFNSEKERKERMDGQTQMIKLKFAFHNFETYIKTNLHPFWSYIANSLSLVLC